MTTTATEPASTTVELFLTAAVAAADLVASPEVAETWDEPSALESYTVAGLAGHLARAVLVVERYLDLEADTATPDAAPTATTTTWRATTLPDASSYFAAVLGDHDPLASDLHRSVRDRGLRTAAAGPVELAATIRAATDRLRARLDDPTLARPVEVIAGLRLRLDHYLQTRLVELVVHLDDLAVSSEAPAPELPEATHLLVVRVLAETAARRVGGIEAVRALARRERHPDALRAL